MAAGKQKRLAVSVLMAEEHPLAALYLEGILSRGGLSVAPGGRNPSGAADARQQPSVILVDPDPLRQPLGVCLRSFAVRFPEGKTLVVGRTLAVDELCRLLFLGVHGFVAYEDVEADLCRAVRSLAEGHLWVDREVLERFASYPPGVARLKRPRLRSFTAREVLILGLVERGMCDKEISAALGITERTVRFHLQNIFAKLGVHDRQAVVRLARSDLLGRACKTTMGWGSAPFVPHSPAG
jgi:LuxR family transcriptional regulator of csgAB operon